jgi:TolA-binding protein
VYQKIQKIRLATPLSVGPITIFLLSLCIPALRGAASAEDTAGADLRAIQQEINNIKKHESAERQRVDQDERTIQTLEQQLRQLELRNAALAHQADALEVTSQQLKQDRQQLKDLQQQLATRVTDEQFGSLMNRYLGSHQFTWNGAVAGSFIYDRGNNTNTFALTFEPLVIYRLNDWISFVGELEAALPQGSSAEFGLPIAMFQLFLNDYLQVNAGLFDQPFGDWYEAQSALWVNRFITAPLPYGAEAIIPPSELGFQLRGGLQWGALGQDLDYTTWVGNGPSFSTQPEPVPGQTLNPVTNIQTNTNGKAFGTRIRFYPFPLDSNLGRLEVGASTYNGKWMNGNWFNSWGVDYAYLNGNLQTRGEYVQTWRQMPAGSPAPDKRQGWYVQFGYFLQGLPLPQLPLRIDKFVYSLEPLVRYSGVNQPAVVADEISTVPELGFNGSPAIFTPHSREVALGLDYWIEPSIVWQTEFDIELPHAGGTQYSFNGASTPTASPIGATHNDHALLTQLAIGF